MNTVLPWPCVLHVEKVKNCVKALVVRRLLKTNARQKSAINNPLMPFKRFNPPNPQLATLKRAHYRHKKHICYKNSTTNTKE